MRGKRPKEPRVQVITRMPPALKQQIEEYAERNSISVNAACCLLLSEALRADRRREGRRG